MKSFVLRSFLRATLGKLMFAESIPDFVKCIGPTTFCWFPIVSYVCADHNPANYEVYVRTNIQAEVKVLVPCFRNGFLFPSVPQHNCLALVMIQDSLRSYVSRSLFHATMLCVWTDSPTGGDIMLYIVLQYSRRYNPSCFLKKKSTVCRANSSAGVSGWIGRPGFGCVGLQK
jgi:hypothetical protein